MGNCFALHQLTKRKSCSQSTTTRHEDVLRVMKTNGEILDYTRSIFIKGYGNNDHHCFPIWNLGRPFRVAGDHSPTLVSMDNTSGSKRVKMILTKQQLQELLSKKKIAVEEICFLGMQSVALCGVNSSSRWQPGLETILEESEPQGLLCLELKERASRSEPSLFKKFQDFQYLLCFNHVQVSAVQSLSIR
ncbi:hypothetical protein POPTR_001G448600v4 [Populus trichocarpa]|uniref:Uncharacterized protein n=1 Tax=Populus trichocarpa TaxID=3694 RepID=A0ACC0TQS5_POPTR|nr:uncharacterized protein LOC7490701 isoform X1 [Populus trichocarpa]KAI9403563.1 hypothetical protein POPTR_001G448600v4 [Populus trichocarpa]